jgi:hypothetical protein
MKQLLSISAIILALFATSCKKEKDPVPSATTSSLTLKFEHNWGSDGFRFGQQYVTTSLDTVTPTLLRYYISNIKITKTDGSVWAEPESYHLVDYVNAVNGVVTFTIPNVPAGDYASLSYLVGVDSVRNYSGAQTGALDPANNMFWTWNTGYIFFKFEGNTPQANAGKCAYHIGGFTAPFIGSRSYSTNLNGDLIKATPTSIPQVHLALDVSKLFSGAHAWDIDASNSTVHMPSANSVILADNMQTMFSFEHIHN